MAASSCHVGQRVSRQGAGTVIMEYASLSGSQLKTPAWRLNQARHCALPGFDKASRRDEIELVGVAHADTGT